MAKNYDQNLTLKNYFKRHCIKLISEQYSCVGLSLELMKRLQTLEKHFPGLNKCPFLASCEEAVNQSKKYEKIVANDFNRYGSIMDKEHTLIVINIMIGNRIGVLLCDLGYHVARVVTVMKDETYPHTGRFIQTDEQPKLIREYCYKFSETLGHGFIEWHTITTRNGTLEQQMALIYAKKPYLTAIDVTERRNLVYSFRSLVSRNTKGSIIAGIYFTIRQPDAALKNLKFTARYQQHGVTHIRKIPFSEFLSDTIANNKNISHLDTCSVYMNITTEDLLRRLRNLAQLFSDRKFVAEILEINKKINKITKI